MFPTTPNTTINSSELKGSSLSQDPHSTASGNTLSHRTKANFSLRSSKDVCQVFFLSMDKAKTNWTYNRNISDFHFNGQVSYVIFKKKKSVDLTKQTKVKQVRIKLFRSKGGAGWDI